MLSIAKFNQLGGKDVSRADLIELKNLASKEQEFSVYNRVSALLDKYPDVDIFTIELEQPINISLAAPSIKDLEVFEIKDGLLYMVNGENAATINNKGLITWHKKGLGSQIREKIRNKAHQGLGAARHSGVAKDGLDECGRLQPGYKFEGSRVVKVSEAAKRKTVVNNRNSNVREISKKVPKVVSIPPKEDKEETKKYDFIYEVGYNGSYPIKSFIVFPAMKGLTNEGKNSTVENLISYRATKKALEKLQTLYPTNAYGNKHELSYKNLNLVTEEYKRKNKPASNYGKKRPRSKQEKALFSLNDIPYEVAYRAHTGTSFSPEKRAKSEQENYFNSLQEVYNENLARAKKLNLENELDTRFLRFKERYLKLNLEYLRSRSGVYSTMISGGSNFPVARMQKKNAVVDKKSKAVLDYFNNYQNLFHNEMKPVIIKTGSSEALIQLKEKLRKEEEAHQQTLAFNKIMRKKVSNDEKEKELIKAGFGQKLIETARKEGFFELGSYVSSNRSARMRELKRRIKVEENIKQKSATIGNLEFSFDGGTVVKNLEINRLQILFDTIPDATLRSALKKGGLAFKWSPSNSAWQRQLNTFYSVSYADLEKLLPGLSFEKKKDKPTITSKSHKAIIDNLPLSKITLDTNRFQNRSKLNPTIVKNIVDNFNETELDPLIVWKSKNKVYLLAGHHRYEGLTQLKKKVAPVKYFYGTEAEAIEFAKVKSNSNRSLETPLERAKIYREMATKKAKSIVEAEAKRIEGKNANYILNLAALNTKGEVINAIEKLAETTDKQNATLVEKIADWTGQARRNYDQLTNEHEREMFLFLMDKEASKRITTKAEFLQKIFAIVGAFDFEAKQPLNLKRFKFQTEGEKVYNSEYDDLKQNLENKLTEKANLLDRLSNPTNPNFIPATDVSTSELAAKKLVSLNQEIGIYQKKLIELSQNKGKYTKSGDNQIGLFSPAIIPYQIEESHVYRIPEELISLSQTIKENENNQVAKNRLMQMHFDSLEMDEGWEKFMQNPAKNIKIAISGQPKNGKTAGSLLLANYLTKFGNVLYNFADQGFNKSTQDLWRLCGLEYNEKATPSDITTLQKLNEEIATEKYSFVFIDMINDYVDREKISPAEFKDQFVNKYPNVGFILVMEATKAGDFKGDNKWMHVVDAIAKVEDFVMTIRGRYGMGHKIIWEEGLKTANPKKYDELIEEVPEADEINISTEVESI